MARSYRPCSKPPQPFLSSNAQGQGPGEASLFAGKHGRWIVYSPLAVHYRTDSTRPVVLAHIAFDRSGPYLAAFARDTRRVPFRVEH